jgi:hypothetical protein
MFSGSGVYVAHLIHSATTLNARWHQIKTAQDPPSTRLQLVEILREALDLDAEFQLWETALPRSWQYETKPNTVDVHANYDHKWVNLMLASNGAPAQIQCFGSLRRAWVNANYCTTRLFLLRALLEIINWMLKLPEPNPSDGHVSQASAEGLIYDTTLHIQHAYATNHISNLVERSCAAIVGCFTVPVDGRTDADVMGLRGYICLWSLVVMDCTLRSGVVPDAGPAPQSPPSKPSSPLSPPHLFTSSAGMPVPSPSISKMPMRNMSPLYYDAATVARNPNDFHNPLHAQAPQGGQGSTDLAGLCKATVLTPSMHSLPEQKPKIDVVARKEWIQRLLYYSAAHLGIKKAYAFLTLDQTLLLQTEGVFEKSRYAVEAMVGKP